MAHLIETYSLGASAAKIDKPFIYEKYIPLPNVEKWITFQPFSKPSKSYDFWNEVMTILKPILDKEKISVIQLGAKDETPIRGTLCLSGQTSLGQMAYLINNSILHLGCDSIGIHYASSFKKKIVGIYSNNYIKCVGPYFSKKEDIILLEPPRQYNEKPTFSLQEMPKTINKILPEEIAVSVCKLLNIPFTYIYKTLYVGDIALAPMVISVCDSVINPNQLGVNQMIMDATLNFNEEILTKQAQICDISIITNKELSANFLNFAKQSRRVKEIIYVIEENNSPDFVKALISTGIPFRMFSNLSQEAIDKIKSKYFEYGAIFKKPTFKIENIKELKYKDLDSLYFRSSKFFAGRGKIYPSRKHYIDDISISNYEELLKIINHSDFFDELDSFRILEKI